MSTPTAGGAVAGRAAIVTGAARGIGLATARRLGREGASVLMVDIDGDALAEVEAALAGEGHRVVAVAADVADPESTAGFVAAAVDAFGRLDILVNNAAALDPATLGRDSDVVDVPFEVWHRTFDVNLFGPMVACRHALPHLIASKGAIVNISTIGALRGRWNQVAYGVSKAGLNALTEYVATTYGRSDVRCNAVAPGLVLTENAERDLSPQYLADSAADRLVARPGRPDDIADAVLFLASDQSSYITGQVLVVDGGTINHVPGYATHAPGARLDG